MLKINNKELAVSSFPDGTPLIKFTDLELRDTEQVILWKYENMEELFLLYSITRQLQSYGTKIRLVMPYVPNARQDRVQKEKEDIFTLKWFCEIINGLNYTRVTIVDIHSNVTPALLNNCHCINNQRIFDKAKELTNPDMVFYPDNGACKKYSEYIESPYAFGIKHRDWQTGKILGLEVAGDVWGKDILIVDDICSKGGTFFYAAKALKEAGAGTINLLVTHCENSILDGELIKSDLIDNIYTTDSIYSGYHKKIKVLQEF